MSPAQKANFDESEDRLSQRPASFCCNCNVSRRLSASHFNSPIHMHALCDLLYKVILIFFSMEITIMRFLSGTLKGRERVWSRDKNLASHVCNCASICRAGGVPKGGCIPPVFPHARSEEGCLDFFWVDLVRTDWPPLQGPAGCTTARSFLFFIFWSACTC